MPVMDPDRCEDLGEMYFPYDQGEYTPLDEAPCFSLQRLSNALADIGEGTGQTSAEEYTLMLEVMMADHPGQPHPPAFSWNAGMVMHILKSDPVLRELEHVQVDDLVLPTCFSMTSRAIRVWSRVSKMLPKHTWRRPSRSGSHTLPTSTLASSP